MKNLSAIIRLLLANAISGFAQGISMIAIPWYFAQQDASSMFGIIYGLVTLISLFWGLYAGTLVDRLNRKWIFIAENGIGMVLLFSVAAYGFYLGALPTWAVAGIFATTFFTYNVHYPALYAFMQEITLPKHYSRITSYMEIQGQLTTVAAGGIGAMLLSGVDAGSIMVFGQSISVPFSIEAWPIHKIFLLDGCTYVLALLTVLSISYEPIAVRVAESSSIKKRFEIGVQFLRKYPVILKFGVAAHFVFVTTMIINFLLMPKYLADYLKVGGGAYAFSEMLFALGAVFSGAVVVRLFYRYNTVMGNIVFSLISAACFLILVFSRSITVFFIIILLLGMANSGARIMRVTYFFKHIPNQIIGRTGSIFQLINVLFRLGFIWLFSIPFFLDNIWICFLTFSLGLVIAAGVLVYYYRPLVALHTDYIPPNT